MIYKFLECSTAYITKKDNVILQEVVEDGGPLLVTQYPGGYMINLPSKGYLGSYKKATNELNLSKSFFNLVKYAVGQDCVKLFIDCDGSTDLKLRKFDW